MKFMLNYPDRMPATGGEKTFMAEKILHGLVKFEIIDYPVFAEYLAKLNARKKVDHSFFDVLHEDYNGKIHTIRKTVQVNKGNLINFKDDHHFEFAPKVKCTGHQKIIFHRIPNEEEECDDIVILIDGRQIREPEAKELASNSGFDSMEQMFEFFDDSKIGYIHHWTDYRYSIHNIVVNKPDTVEVEKEPRKCDCWLENPTCFCEV